MAVVHGVAAAWALHVLLSHEFSVGGGHLNVPTVPARPRFTSTQRSDSDRAVAVPVALLAVSPTMGFLDCGDPSGGAGLRHASMVAWWTSTPVSSERVDVH